MSIFGSIMGAIFGHGSAQASVPPTPTPVGGAPDGAPPPSSATTAPATPDAPAAATPQTIDVAAIVDRAAALTGEKLDWRTSIVDLMKALGLDSSLAARKQLAHELNYTGDTGNSVAMNVWLHKEIMGKLAANGGKLPSDIKI